MQPTVLCALPLTFPRSATHCSIHSETPAPRHSSQSSKTSFLCRVCVHSLPGLVLQNSHSLHLLQRNFCTSFNPSEVMLSSPHFQRRSLWNPLTHSTVNIFLLDGQGREERTCAGTSTHPSPAPDLTYLPNLQNALMSHMDTKHKLGFVNAQTLLLSAICFRGHVVYIHAHEVHHPITSQRID